MLCAMDRRKRLPLLVRVAFSIGPLVAAIAAASFHVSAVVVGNAANSGRDLVIYASLIIAASLWAVYIFRRTAPDT